MLVQVDKFIFPVNFVVMDMAGESNVPLILGKPFLATTRAIIDVSDGKLKLRVGEESVTFHLDHALKHSLDHDDTAYGVDTLYDTLHSPLSGLSLTTSEALQDDESDELPNEKALVNGPVVSTNGFDELDMSGM